ncbi:CRISPR-associated protein Csx20 [uncultured Fusobacterium sp.]|uniref:CRISPR-associated protein Csx20 n=1 Tax=uncultured Fusobacterium sp. TaxID=159267 RepID=UPI0025D75A8C|nr:CRISPR-associated protein Csx20 [uncultured Fusobacterium sp.]MCF2639922.1 hypothetical protein [Fusobacterium varium]
MDKRLILLFSHQLTPQQLKDAKETLQCNKIIYLTDELLYKWQNITPETDIQIFKDFLVENAKVGDYVLIQGEWGTTYNMVNFAKEKNMIPIYSSTARKVIEEKSGSDNKVIKTSIFEHRGFYRY